MEQVQKQSVDHHAILTQSFEQENMLQTEAAIQQDVVIQDEPSVIAYKDLSRRDIRSLIFHLLYIAESCEYQESLQSIVDTFADGYSIEIPRHSEVFSVANQIIQQKDALDASYEPLLSNWRMDRLSVCTKLILRFALWELENADVDNRIVINEAIELAKCFAEKDAHKFINGVLDKTINKD